MTFTNRDYRGLGNGFDRMYIGTVFSFSTCATFFGEILTVRVDYRYFPPYLAENGAGASEGDGERWKANYDFPKFKKCDWIVGALPHQPTPLIYSNSRIKLL